MLIMWRLFSQRVAGRFRIGKIVQTSFQPREGRTPREQFALLPQYDFIYCVKIVLQLHTTDFQLCHATRQHFSFTHANTPLHVYNSMQH